MARFLGTIPSQEKLVKTVLAVLAAENSMINNINFDWRWPADQFGGTVTININLPHKEFYRLMDEARNGYQQN